MREKENIIKELQGQAPELAQFKQDEQEPGFQVPPGYFRDLTKVVMQEIQQELPAASPTSTARWWTQVMQQLQVLWHPKPALALASIGLLIAIGLWWNPFGQDLSTNTPSMALNNDELEAYVMANIDNFDTELLIEMYAETFPEEEEQPITEENLEELLEEMNDADFEELWESDTFKEDN